MSFSNAWKWKVEAKSLSRVRLWATPWTAAHQAPPSMGFSRQECWCGVPMPSPSETLDMIKNNCQNRKHQHVEGQQDERGRELGREGFLEEWSPGAGWQCRAPGAGDTKCQGTHPAHQQATRTRNSRAPQHTLEQAPPRVCSWGLTALPPACSPNF